MAASAKVYACPRCGALHTCDPRKKRCRETRTCSRCRLTDRLAVELVLPSSLPHAFLVASNPEAYDEGEWGVDNPNPSFQEE